MTSRMKLVVVLSAAVSAFLVLILSTPLVIDAGLSMLSTLGHALGLHGAPISSALAVLGTLLLYLVFMKTRHSYYKKGGV
jgi:hypothetical protein